ncbi:hypothetical protein [Kitasatospora purpeofusca]|uniref:hypothetical protein n=1 Tax=Kitasatospora purpeofusca TaxID=67352 RepID=UPI00225ADE26|nr:hypothetical protein [Kitasatospora purpeofusca]MCX4682723.1 hypothetical protein [Kitasatospora purpeofusca]MCX4690613.1 hypothetical protein [Kitasatospora purpeofusca]MCX4690795.1 hypothetical protein [Kitasatospora purpeofusca]
MTVDLAAARRRLGVAGRDRGCLLGAGLVLWCDPLEDPGSVDAVVADLVLLGVPCRTVAAARPPRRPGLRPRAGVEVRVAQGRPLEVLRRQASSVLRQIPRGAPVDSEFDLAVWDLDGAGVEVPVGAAGGLAADWPHWEGWQAAAMGLTCRSCPADLRPQAPDDVRRAFREPGGSPGWPPRLLCEGCRWALVPDRRSAGSSGRG